MSIPLPNSDLFSPQREGRLSLLSKNQYCKNRVNAKGTLYSKICPNFPFYNLQHKSNWCSKTLNCNTENMVKQSVIPDFGPMFH